MGGVGRKVGRDGAANGPAICVYGRDGITPFLGRRCAHFCHSSQIQCGANELELCLGLGDAAHTNASAVLLRKDSGFDSARLLIQCELERERLKALGRSLDWRLPHTNLPALFLAK